MPLLLFSNIGLALQRHWTKSVSFAAAAAMLTLVGLKYLPPQYSSEAKLFVKVSGIDAADAPQALAAERNQIAQDLGDSAQLTRLVDTIGPQRIMSGPLPSDSPAQREEALQLLRQSVTIAVLQDSSEVVVRAAASRPEMAHQIVATLVETYLQGRERTTRSPSMPPAPTAPEPVADEQTALENEWKAASARLREAQGINGDLSLSARRRLIEDQLAEVEVMLASELSKHEDEERKLATKLTPDHPLLVAIRELIGDLSQQIQDAKSKGADAAPAAMPSDTRIPGRVGLLCSRWQILQVELAELNQQEGRVAAADQQVTLAKSRLESLARQREVVRAATAQQVTPSVEISVVQPATAARQTAGFDPQHVIALGAALSFIGGLAVALLCNRSNPLLMTRRAVERELELAVSGPIPTADEPLDVAV